MAISPSLRRYLNEQGVPFEEISHARSMQTADAAHAAHVPSRYVAKGVLLYAENELLLAVVPASRQIDLVSLRTWLRRDVTLAGEEEVTAVLSDCDYGAVPPVGGAFGLETIVDDEILAVEEIYFEGGDHRTLVHVSAPDWRRLMGAADHCAFSV